MPQKIGMKLLEMVKQMKISIVSPRKSMGGLFSQKGGGLNMGSNIRLCKEGRKATHMYFLII